MGINLQESLLDLSDEPAELSSLVGVRRVELSDGAWIDVLPGWVIGSDQLFWRLVDSVPWRAERRQMYERVVDVPRLLSYYGDADVLPDPLVTSARDALSDHYWPELGEPFTTAMAATASPGTVTPSAEA